MAEQPEATEPDPPAKPQRLPFRRRLRRKLLLTAVLTVGATILLLPWWSARALSRELSRFFHRPVVVGAIRYHLSPFEPIDVEILDLRIAGASAGEPAFLEVTAGACGDVVEGSDSLRFADCRDQIRQGHAGVTLRRLHQILHTSGRRIGQVERADLEFAEVQQVVAPRHVD